MKQDNVKKKRYQEGSLLGLAVLNMTGDLDFG